MVTVKALLVNHVRGARRSGNRFETPDLTLVVSRDTASSQNVVENCSGCDMLVHEVHSWLDSPGGPCVAKVPFDLHTSSSELAALANKARPKLLVLYHQLIWSSTEEELLKQIQRFYKGEVISGHDLDVF